MPNQRIWDGFLTPQDRAHVASTVLEPPPPVGHAPALLLIDLYRWAYGDRPLPLLESVQSWPGSCGLAGWNAIEPTSRLLAAARAAGIPVIHATLLEVELPRPPRRLKRHAVTALANPDLASDAFATIDEFRPVEGELVIRKLTASAFAGTPLTACLQRIGCDSLIVAGETTSGCVRATVVDAWTLGYPVIVVEDCVFDRHEASHAMSLFDMDQKYGSVQAVDVVTAALDARVSAAPS